MNDRLSSLRFACMGDSITSDEVTGTGTLICRKLGMHLVGNYAHGNATCSDYCDEAHNNQTAVSLEDCGNTFTSANTLSNQVRRLLAHTTGKNEIVHWQHPLDGAFSLPPEAGTGEGFTEDIPDVVYIAISCNDGRYTYGCHTETPVFDNTEEMFRMPYASLDRVGISSALRWAVETLQSAYPDVLIFLSSPLQANGTLLQEAFAPEILKQKREIIRKTASLCSVFYIDAYGESGFSSLWARAGGDGLGIHPNAYWKSRIAAYVAHEIRMRVFPFDT